MKKNNFNYVKTIIGVVMLIVGVYFVKTLPEPQGIMRVLPYVFIGLGCSIFGYGIGEILTDKAMKNSPDARKKMEIEMKDERNVVIKNSAKAKAYDMMIFVFGALLISFGLMGVDLIAVLLLAFTYMFVTAYGVYYQYKFYKKY